MSTRSSLNHYLLVFDHAVGALAEDVIEFTDVEEAVAAYEQAEARFEKADRVEVVLIGSDSLDTVRATHGNYFDGTAALARALVDILRDKSMTHTSGSH